jgi:hypothetical protein
MFRNERRLQLIEYRRLQRCSLRVLFEAPLVTKGGLRSASVMDRLRREILAAMKLYSWKYAPRAKIALSLRFLDGERNHPDLHHLVKFYLDALKSTAFADDRQVQYLEASTLRHSDATRSCVIYEVWRLRDYERCLDVVRDERSRNHERCRSLFSPYTLDSEYWITAERQQEVLEHAPVLSHTRRMTKAGAPRLMDIWSNLAPLVLDLGSLARDDAGRTLEERIQEAFAAQAATGKLFSRIYTPIDLNAQITRKGYDLVKDVDNVFRSLCKIMRRTVLQPSAYVTGYRVYVASDDDRPPQLTVQLLAPGQVEAHREHMERAFEVYGKKLED